MLAGFNHPKGGVLVLLVALALLGFMACEAPVNSLSGSSANTRAAAAATPWAVGVTYSVGQLVTYNGNEYSCIQAHTSLAGWDPVDAPALWALVGPVTTTPTTAPTAAPTATPVSTAVPTPTAKPTTAPTAAPVPTPSGSVPPTTLATGVPGTPNLSPSVYTGASSYSILMNMWWGNNGTTWQLYENGTLVSTVYLTDNSPNAQTASVALAGRANGTYTYTTKLTNSYGTTTGNTLTYTVTQGGTAAPTPTPVPTATAVPTATPKATATPVPTATPAATPVPTPTPVPNSSLTVGSMANLNGRYYAGYYCSWSDNWFTSTNSGTGAALTDNQIYAASNLCQVPGQVTHVMVAFAQPNFSWSGLSANSWSGTGLSFSSAPQDIYNSIRILHELGRKVILSVGGATYTNWTALAAEAGQTGTPIKTALAKFMTDMNVDGLDVDCEISDSSNTDTADMTTYAQSIQAMREAVDLAGGNRTLALAGWSTGADYTSNQTTQAGYPGTVSYWGGNAGRERAVFQMAASGGSHAGQSIGSLLNMVNVMTYDAGYQNFDAVTSWKEYRALVSSSTTVGIGIEIPTEAWGGATVVLYNSDAGAAGTEVVMNQYNVTENVPYSVQRMVGAVTSNTVNANAHDGAMVWDLQKTTSPTDANSTSVSTYIGTLFGWTAVTP